MKDSIIRFWITHHYLRKVGKRYPAFFKQLINEITDNLTAKRIMEKRYIDNIKFEAIAYDMNIDVRYVFRLHRQVIDNLIKI